MTKHPKTSSATTRINTSSVGPIPNMGVESSRSEGRAVTPPVSMSRPGPPSFLLCSRLRNAWLRSTHLHGGLESRQSV